MKKMSFGEYVRVSERLAEKYLNHLERNAPSEMSKKAKKLLEIGFYAGFSSGTYWLSMDGDENIPLNKEVKFQ